ncbi:MAG: S9 family peptidase, partial [Sphingomicrobium sp.]
MADLPDPPVADRRPHEYTRHGVTIRDDWAWLRDPGYPEVKDEAVLAYLKAENAYFEAAMAPHAALVETLFQEMKGRIKQDLSSVPAPDGPWEYWWAFKPGEQYRRWYRRHRTDGTEQLIFDEVAAAEGHDYFRLGAIVSSPDYRLLATQVDDDGSERFKLQIRDIESGEILETVTSVAIGSPVWSADSKGVAYTEVNEHWRSDRAKYHRLGDDPAGAVTLYEETRDKGFSVGLGKSQDDRLIVIAAGDNTSSEVRFVPADDPAAPATLVTERRRNVEYHCDAAHGRLWIVTNDAHVNFRLVSAKVETPGEWCEEIAGSDRVYLRHVTSYRDHLALSTRVDGLDQLILRSYVGEERRIPFAEASYSAAFAGNADFAPPAYRIGYSSMV